MASLPSIVYRLSSTQSAIDFNLHRQRWVALGCAVALLTFLIHGVLDMFLEYTATNLLLWALIGALGSLTSLGHGSDVMRSSGGLRAAAPPPK
jgi:hypothetical protein